MLNFGNKEFRNLQEQVLKNAQDIETLKGRENLQIVIVDELPEVGNPDYIYLVAKDDGESPDVYDEYIWLEDEERYEKIGGVTIDLTNYVTTDTEQTITGVKTFSSDVTFTTTYVSSIKNNYNQNVFALANGQTFIYSKLIPSPTATLDLGANTQQWKDLYLSGTAYVPYVYFGENKYIDGTGSALMLRFGGSPIRIRGALQPADNNNWTLGASNLQWKDLYLAGNITDGLNAVSVANIASKVTSTFISGTFDANGESTIDTEQAGTPEGLFIFTYGNCQCFLRLTAAMVSSADVTPIRVSCPMITSGSPYLGWLEIERSSNTLTISVKDENIHVDSGFAWTLTKTNLL